MHLQIKSMIARLVFYVLVCATGLPSHAENTEFIDPQKVQSQLDALNAEIENYRILLEKTRSQRSEIESELQKNEEAMGALIQKIRQIESELKEGKEKITSLEADREELQFLKTAQQKHIKKQIRAAHAIGNQQHIKILLNQEDPAEINRMLTYLDYFNRARAEYVDRYTEILASLRRVEANIVKQTKQLSASRDELSRQHQQMTMAREKREISLAFLKQTMRSKGDELNKLINDRKGLESVLARINKELNELPAIKDLTPFAEQRGKLPLPVVGRITNRFGSSRNKGKLRWQGIFISADEGQPIHAVHHGRVVFSDWLRGFGLLLIINHGDGYMSLYGHNQSLYRQTGDWVAANEVISTAGTSGGQEKPGLYFEIRQKGEPKNPSTWCTARA
jgi:septal ring factor EnvC (AmiA/AmiB activator)